MVRAESDDVFAKATTGARHAQSTIRDKHM